MTFNGSGSWIHTGTLDVNGNLYIAQGTLNSSGQNITLGGNWTNAATYTHGNSTVTLDGGSQTIASTTTFYNLTKSVTSAATLTFEAGKTQTIANTMSLDGDAGQLLSLRSSSTGSQWSIDPQGTRTIEYLDVQDSANINATSIATAGFNITNSGGNTGWTFAAAGASTPARPLRLLEGFTIKFFSGKIIIY